MSDFDTHGETIYLWRLSQDFITGYDTYDSCVVAARTEDEARKIDPGGDRWDGSSWVYTRTDGSTCSSYDDGSWCTPEHVLVEKVGVAIGFPVGAVICSSFNAG